MKAMMSRKGTSNGTSKTGKSRARASSSSARGVERNTSPTPNPMAATPRASDSTTSWRCSSGWPRSRTPVVSMM
jgi:hypothetical protein